MQNATNDISTLLIITLFLIMLMAGIIFLLIFLQNKRQLDFQKEIKKMENSYEKNILNSQLEIQEQTFQHISREIHDNISLSLTLAKLHLHTLDWQDRDASKEKVDTSLQLIGKSIAELSDISKSMDSDIITQHGLLAAIEEELQRIRFVRLFEIDYKVTGTPVYLHTQEELVIFRIIQEAFNNIIKHAGASSVQLILSYNEKDLVIDICDNGNGFDTGLTSTKNHSGLKNMETRVQMLKGNMKINSNPGKGTRISFTIPY